jgi:hypothetical protein
MHRVWIQAFISHVIPIDFVDRRDECEDPEVQDHAILVTIPGVNRPDPVAEALFVTVCVARPQVMTARQ